MKTHGSRVTRGHGMRRGISLVEMLMAIVLLGLLGTISYNYYKVYYDTAFAAKQARIYVILDQAQQLSNAHDLYEVKNGAEPITIGDMVSDKQLITTPDNIPLVSSTGWKLHNPQTGADAAIEIDDTVASDNDVAFYMSVDGVDAAGTATANKDRLDYCNILSNTGNGAWSLSAVDTDYSDIGATPALAYNHANLGDTFYCYSTGANLYHFVFVKRIDIQ